MVQTTHIRARLWLAILGAALIGALASAQGAAAYRVVGVTAENPSRVAVFSTGAPQQVELHTVNLPVGADPELIGLAFRPGTDDLYAIGGDGAVYVLSETLTTAVPLGPPPAVDPISSPDAGVGFEPTSGLLRVFGGPDRDLAFEPLNGQQVPVPDSPKLAYGADDGGGTPDVLAAAFRETEPEPGTNRERQALFGIDGPSASLVSIGYRGALSNAVALAGSKPLGPVAGLAVPQVGDAEQNRSVAVLQRAGGTGSELCRVALGSIYVEKMLVKESAGIQSCVALGGGAPIRGIAIAPYSVVGFEAGQIGTEIEATEGQYSKVGAVRTGNLDSRIVVGWSALPVGQGTDPMLTGLHGTFTFEPGQSRATSLLNVPENRVVEHRRRLRIQLEPGEHDDWAPGASSTANVRVVDDDLSAGWAHPRHLPSLGKVLRSGRIALPFHCSQACGWYATLQFGGERVARSSQAVGYEGRRRIVFALGDPVRRELRESAGRNGVVLHAWGRFDPSYGDAIKEKLRLRLRPAGRARR